MPENNELKVFLEEKPIYSKFKINVDNIDAFADRKKVKLHCAGEICNDMSVFSTSTQYISNSSGIRICIAKCSACDHKIEYYLELIEDEDFSKNEYTPDVTYSIRKVGQNPAFQYKKLKTINNYLTDSDKKLYDKAIRSYNQGMGVGSFTYYRRIIENEVKRIFNERGVILHDDIKTSTKQIEDSFPLLPVALQKMATNPILSLWSMLSSGIHNLNDDDCIARCREIETVFLFVIDKLNEEKTTLKDTNDSLIRLNKLILQEDKG